MLVDINLQKMRYFHSSISNPDVKFFETFCQVCYYKYAIDIW